MKPLTNNTLKILQIAPCYVDIYKETGGVANIIRQICLKLEQSKIPTVLICSNTELGRIVAKPDIIKYSDFLTIHIISQYKNPLLGPVNNIRSILKSTNNISVAHVHTCFSAITEYSVKHFIKNNIPCIFTPHGKLSPTMFENRKLFKQVYFNLFVRKYLNQVSQFITSSSNEIEYAKAMRLNGNFSFIYNGCTPVKIKDIFKNQWHLKPKSYLLFLGYLDSRKQPDLLIRAFSKAKVLKEFKLVLAGPDSYGFRQYLEALVVSLNLVIGKDVIFTDRVLGDVKWDLLHNAKALFLPSKGEGWPVVIAEAIGAQIPCVISKECNFSEINEMRLGIEVNDFSIENWASAIDDICYNDVFYNELKLNLYASKSLFTWDSITNDWINIYSKTIDEAGA